MPPITPDHPHATPASADAAMQDADQARPLPESNVAPIGGGFDIEKKLETVPPPSPAASMTESLSAPSPFDTAPPPPPTPSVVQAPGAPPVVVPSEIRPIEPVSVPAGSPQPAPYMEKLPTQSPESATPTAESNPFTKDAFQAKTQAELRELQAKLTSDVSSFSPEELIIIGGELEQLGNRFKLLSALDTAA